MFSDKTLLITGGTGSFGSTVLKRFLDSDIKEMANIIKQNMGTGKIWHIPLWLVKILARIGDICKSFGWYSVPLSSFRLNNIITEYIYDLEPIIKISGPLPFNLNTGIKRTVKWLRETGEISN